jgi:hypothetical protein
MNLSLSDDDMHHYDIYNDLFASSNFEMYSVLRAGLGITSGEKADCERQDWRAANAYSNKKNGPINLSNTVSPPREIHNLPSVSNLATPMAVPESTVVAETRWRGVDSMPLSDSMPRRPMKQSYKETESTFEILFSYQAVVTSRVVNKNLPGRGYLENDFGFRLSSDHDLELEFEGRLITQLGVLDDMPFIPDSVIVVRYPIKPPVSEESPGTPSTKFGPSFCGENQYANHAESRGDPVQSKHNHAESRGDPMQSKQTFPGRSSLEKDGNDLYDTVVFQSLDPRSYDKIRQNFKYPKFSGQARD